MNTLRKAIPALLLLAMALASALAQAVTTGAITAAPATLVSESPSKQIDVTRLHVERETRIIADAIRQSKN
jgi:hypothetical protein